MKPNLFNSIQLYKPKKNVFDLSHDFKFSGDMGNLIPIMLNECVPGDSYVISCEAMVRFAPMLAPIMHRVDVSMHYFFVPNRILWDNWEKFIVDSSISAPVMPYLPSDVFKPQNSGPLDAGPTAALFADYLGIPTPARKVIAVIKIMATTITSTTAPNQVGNVFINAINVSSIFILQPVMRL